MITHADGSFSRGGSFEFGLREFEVHLFLGPGLFANFAGMNNFGRTGHSALGVLHAGDTLAYVYTLTAQRTTHGGEHGYYAFLGDPFGVDVAAGNLGVKVAIADVPEPGMCALMMRGITGLPVWRKCTHRAPRPNVPHQAISASCRLGPFRQSPGGCQPD